MKFLCKVFWLLGSVSLIAYQPLIMSDQECCEKIDFELKHYELDFLAQCFSLIDSKNDHKKTNKLPERILNWGSQGRGGDPWQFQEPMCNQFFEELFFIIKNSSQYVDLTPHDLFHAHVIQYTIEGKNSYLLLFHAREYPADIEKVKNQYQVESEMFFSHEQSFVDRNFLFHLDMSSPKAQAKLFLVNESGVCEKFFSLMGINYLSEEKIASNLPQGKLLGDMNFFKKENIQRISYKFFPGISEYSSFYYEDLENYQTGKSVIQRELINQELQSFMIHNDEQNIFYILSAWNSQSE